MEITTITEIVKMMRQEGVLCLKLPNLELALDHSSLFPKEKVNLANDVENEPKQLNPDVDHLSAEQYLELYQKHPELFTASTESAS